jgi:peptide-methionine (R)-S-oxide reductase
MVGACYPEIRIMVTRRFLLASSIAGVSLAIGLPRWGRTAGAAEVFEVTHTEAEWRKLLTPEQYAILRQAGTERPFSSPLLKEARAGIYACVGCGQDAFSSNTKYDPGEGWPSFWQFLDKAVATTRDTSFGMIRTEVHCSRCGSHLGHLFDDGPQPTGLRYCMDGVALNFKPAAA